jgi:hypothetical protein
MHCTPILKRNKVRSFCYTVLIYSYIIVRSFCYARLEMDHCHRAFEDGTKLLSKVRPHD